jgi:osmotically-inducible protein OsmY
MKTLAWLTPVVFSAALILPGCEDSSTSNTTAPENRTTAAKMSNSDLELVVRTTLESDQDIKDASLSVRAEVDENKVTISGTVPSQDIRSKAIELARAAQPGLIVNDEIEVKPAG